MTDVYVVQRDEAWDGAELVYIASNREKATDYIHKIAKENPTVDYFMERWIVDKTEETGDGVRV